MMKNLSKEKRDHLILTIIGTAIVLVGIGMFLIKPTSAKITKLEKESIDLSDNLTKAQRRLKMMDEIDATLTDANARLSDIREAMPSGDLYASMINLLNNIKVRHNIKIPQISREVTGKAMMYPDFPFIVASFRVGGSGYYHNIGSFIADFENSFPFMRIQNVVIEKAIATETVATSGSEQLNFRMEIIALLDRAPNADTPSL